jgi:hypothetical protein
LHKQKGPGKILVRHNGADLPYRTFDKRPQIELAAIGPIPAALPKTEVRRVEQCQGFTCRAAFMEFLYLGYQIHIVFICDLPVLLFGVSSWRREFLQLL